MSVLIDQRNYYYYCDSKQKIETLSETLSLSTQRN